MRIILVSLIVIISTSLYGQDKLTKEIIDSIYQSRLANLANLEVFIIAKYDSIRGDFDTLKLYSKNDTLYYVSNYSCLCGSDVGFQHGYLDMVFHNGILVFEKSSVSIEYLDKGYTEESTTNMNEVSVYYNLDGKCLKHYLWREATGNRLTVEENLANVPLEEGDCDSWYNIYRRNRSGDKYIEMFNELREKNID